MATAALPVDSTASDRRAVGIWLLGCAALVFAMVVIGGVTRLTESGLSITEWKPIAGIVPPLGDAAWEDAFAKYRTIPEFSEKNAGMTLTEFKTIYWWEWLHRLWGRLIGVAFALPFLWFLARRRIRGRLAWQLGGVFALGGLQGAIGWWMVASGLVDRIDVSQYRLALHLGLALVIYACLLRLAFGLLRPRPMPAPRGPRRAANLTLALSFATLIAGAFVAGTDAGLIYNSFPLMDGRLVPEGYLDFTPWWNNLFENRTAIQFNHRWLGIATFAACVAMWLILGRREDSAPARVQLRGLAAMAALQALLGIATLLAAVPVWLGALHQAGAVALLTLALATRHALGR